MEYIGNTDDEYNRDIIATGDVTDTTNGGTGDTVTEVGNNDALIVGTGSSVSATGTGETAFLFAMAVKV